LDNKIKCLSLAVFFFGNPTNKTITGLLMANHLGLSDPATISAPFKNPVLEFSGWDETQPNPTQPQERVLGS
jgi:hypothetical protein